jgi:hypothetical protein
VTASGTQPQTAPVVSLPQTAAAAPKRLDVVITAGVAAFWEFGAKPLYKLLAADRRHRHF